MMIFNVLMELNTNSWGQRRVCLIHIINITLLFGIKFTNVPNKWNLVHQTLEVGGRGN